MTKCWHCIISTAFIEERSWNRFVFFCVWLAVECVRFTLDTSARRSTAYAVPATVALIAVNAVVGRR